MAARAEGGSARCAERTEMRTARGGAHGGARSRRATAAALDRTSAGARAGRQGNLLMGSCEFGSPFYAGSQLSRRPRFASGWLCGRELLNSICTRVCL